MALIQRPAQAGTLESSDILIMIAPGEPGKGIVISLESPVQKQFGRRITSIVTRHLQQANIQDAEVHIQDRGALDYAIEARIETAIARATAPADKEPGNA